MNPTIPIESNDMPMEDLTAAERKVEAEGQLEKSEASGSSETSALQKCYSSAHVRGAAEDNNVIDKDEITVGPIQERSGRDIRFGDLSHPPKHERSDSEGPPNEDVG